MKKLKEEKLKKFKQKQINFLEKGVNEEEMKDEYEKKNSTFSELDEIIECCICRNDNPQNFIYLVGVESRDHESLLNIGPGV